MTKTLSWIILGLPAFILSGSIHEYMHAWAAYKLGDPTATSMGRKTINPLKHIDPFGLLLMVFARFGWMKSVPINENNFRKPVRDTALVALAGPISNLILAIVSSIFLRTIINFKTDFLFFIFFEEFLLIFTWTNIALMFFNIIPLPPLDGYRILRAIIPKRFRHIWEKLEDYSSYVLLLLFLPFSPLSVLTTTLLSDGVQFFLQLLLS